MRIGVVSRWLLLALIGIHLMAGAAWSVEPARVMVLPFAGGAAGSYGYLTDSVGVMVASRLAAKEGVELVDYAGKAEDIQRLESGALELAAQESLFARFKVDYVLSGALYALQTGLQIQVDLATDDSETAPQRFTVLAVNEAAILGAVDELIDDIAGRGFGLSRPTLVPQVETDQPADGLAGFRTEHPEKVFKRGIYGGAIVAEGEGGAQVRATGVRRSSEIPMVMVTMSAADLDNDGTVEVVATSRSSVEVYSFNNDRFTKLASRELPAGSKVHMVNIADLDGDGRGEIYISASLDKRASSVIMSWTQAGGLEELLGDIAWFIRPVQLPGGELILAGQQASPRPEDGFVAKGVSRLKLYPGFAGVREEGRLPLPKGVGLFDFGYGDLDGDGAFETIVVDSREKLLVYDSQNSLLWVSDDDYGGSRNFIGPAWSAVTSIRDMIAVGQDEEKFDRQLVFVPTRIVTTDLDGDGRAEIIIGRNKRIWTKWLRNTREYDGGTVSCLGWREGGLQQLWNTNAISGYVADYYFLTGKDLAGGDEKEKAYLYVAQVPERMVLGFALDADSKLLQYELDLTGAK